MTDVTGTISANGRVNVKKSGTSIGTRRSINLIEGSNISISVGDDPTNEKVDVTINSSGTGGVTPSTTVVPETNYGQSSSPGGSNSYSRGDHTHGSPAKLNIDQLLPSQVGNAGSFLTTNGTNCSWGIPPGGTGVAIPSTVSYVIYIDSAIPSTINAVNGITGDIDFKGNDAATVIQSAINALPKGGIIHLKAGQYNLSSGLLMKGTYNNPKTFILEGDGPESTNITNNSTSPAMTIQTRFGSIIKDMTISGNDTTSGNGIYFISTETGTGGSTHHRLSNLVIVEHNIGIKIEGGVYHVLTESCYIWGNRSHGVQLISGIMPGSTTSYNPNANVFFNTTSTENGGNGFSIEAGNETQLYGCECESNSGYGVSLNSYGNVITMLYVGNNIKGGIILQSACNQNIIMSPNLQGVIWTGSTKTSNTYITGNNLAQFNQ